jgi:8-oxo-dGTP diphosphatase
MEHEKFTYEQKLNHDLRHFPVRPHVGVAGVILWNNQVLIIKRKFDPDAGKWAIPGGHLKLGEKACDGALRECIEETGLDLELGKLAGVIDRIDFDTNDKCEYHYVLVGYYMKVKSDLNRDEPPTPIAQSDVLEAKFVAFEELNKYNLTRTVIELFQNLDIMK